ncbi:MAG: DUF6519 domain-containing protein [bacterium]
MGNSDISRNAFDPAKHYSSVRMQQGRVMVDDDWNENERIRMDQQIKINQDVIGDHGTPDDGFKISFEGETENKKNLDDWDFRIQKGTYYVEGLRVILEDCETYLAQNDWLTLSNDDDNLHKLSDKIDSHTDFVYLEAWQQPVTAVEDGELIEEALGGSDTSTRMRIMHRVRIKKNIKDNEIDCHKQISEVKSQTGQNLIVGFSEEQNLYDLCSPSVQAGYLGAENQAIRVQITGYKKFIWGFNNASPLYKVNLPLRQDDSGNTYEIEMITQPRDVYHRPGKGQIVELLAGSVVLPHGQRIADTIGLLGRVEENYNPGSRTLKITIKDFDSKYFNEWTWDEQGTLIFNRSPEHCFLRVWDMGSYIPEGCEINLDSITNTAILGHSGIKIEFSGDNYKPGDYWIIAARPQTPDKLVPWELQKGGMPPHGIKRYFAPLAFVRWTNESNTINGELIHDCRKTFRPLTELRGCCTFMVGDGKQSNGYFNSIEDALINLPDDGGKICLLPGVHFANVEINKKSNIWIMGCGEKTIVSSALPLTENSNIPDPVFLIRNSENIRITDMTISALFGTAIRLEDKSDPNDPALTASQDIFICDTDISALEYGIRIKVNNTLAGNNNIEIRNNKINLLDDDLGKSAICCLADHVLIEGNRVTIVKEDAGHVASGLPENTLTAVFDRCNKLKRLSERNFNFGLMVVEVRKQGNKVEYQKTWAEFKALGGIQIESGSESVKITGNEIIGGKGNGITLGSYFDTSDLLDNRDNAAYYSNAAGRITHSGANDSISGIVIEQNRISSMGGNGIASAVFHNVFDYLNKKGHDINPEDILEIILMGRVENLTIYRNSIICCAQEFATEPGLNQFGFGGIVLGDCENVMIAENSIEDNGLNYLYPICGIYIYLGEKIEITHNRILNNGKWDDKAKIADLKKGIRSGINIELCNKIQDILNPDGIPAVKIHDNIITQPYGQAVYMKALGPVSVVGNQLTTQNADFFINPISAIAGTVFILNLGISKDYINKYNEDTDSNDTTKKFIGAFLNLFSFLPNGNILFANNQVTLDLRKMYPLGKIASSQFVVSLDDVSYNGNQSEIASFIDLFTIENNVERIKTNVAILASTIRANNNRFQESKKITDVSLLSYGLLLNSAVSNQSSHCIIVLPMDHNSRFVDQFNITLFSPQHYHNCETFRKELNDKLKQLQLISFLTL